MKRFDPLSLINRNKGVFGLNLGHLWDEHRQLQPLMDLILSELRAGRLTPVVARTFPLDKAADAHRFIQSRANIGKVVLTT
jgi:NADPH:quinone reductase-like Zn-dependent oxidoreductase